METRQRRKRHRIEFTDLPYSFEHQIAGAFGEGEHKELSAHVTVAESGVTVSFHVRDHKALVQSTPDIIDAVRFYNDV